MVRTTMCPGIKAALFLKTTSDQNNPGTDPISAWIEEKFVTLVSDQDQDVPHLSQIEQENRTFSNSLYSWGREKTKSSKANYSA